MQWRTTLQQLKQASPYSVAAGIMQAVQKDLLRADRAKHIAAAGELTTGDIGYAVLFALLRFLVAVSFCGYRDYDVVRLERAAG
jgi:hypothetical protein